MEASSFFEKVQLHFQSADLFVEFVFLRICLLADLLAAVAKMSGKPACRRASQRSPGQAKNCSITPRFCIAERELGSSAGPWA